MDDRPRAPATIDEAGVTAGQAAPDGVEDEAVRPPGVDGPLRGLLCRPPVAGRRPAVLVLPEIDGYSPATEAAARRLAGAGYLALALDPFAGIGGTPPLRSRADTVAWVLSLNERRHLSDVAQTIAWARAHPAADGRVGLLGFSAGGRYSLLLATEPHGIGAVVTFYAPPWPRDSLETVLASGEHLGRVAPPICALFGADDDFIPPAVLVRYRAAVAGRAGDEVHVLPGAHLFANPVRRPYRADAAERAWGYALDFLRRHLPLR
ncbi:MAG: dienelactone hydrolase family protein [Acidimicrobiales bacterium]